jgi:hypothetical protein
MVNLLRWTTIYLVLSLLSICIVFYTLITPETPQFSGALWMFVPFVLATVIEAWRARQKSPRIAEILLDGLRIAGIACLIGVVISGLRGGDLFDLIGQHGLLNAILGNMAVLFFYAVAGWGCLFVFYVLRRVRV